MTPTELTCAACGFAVSGYGTDYLFKLFELEILKHITDFDASNDKEVCRAFIFSLRGSKEIYNMMLPRIMARIENYTFNEKCFFLHAFHEKGLLSKKISKDLQYYIGETLKEPEKLSLEELSTVVNVMTKTRACSRDF